MNNILMKKPENLKELQKKLEVERREKEAQEQKQKTELLKQWEGLPFKTQRFGYRVKKDKVFLKREPNAQDSFSISQAEFLKFYSPVE